MPTHHRAPPYDARVKRQIVLPFATALSISFQSLKVRFFRSMITVASLVLAVAFLSHVLITATVAQGVIDAGGRDAARTLIRLGFDVDMQALTVSATAKQRWIVILSMVVCAVGIVNAQLMAVTERFREIGVMKCLGALDSFVLRLFLLEAAMQGVLGAVLGAACGCAAALLSGLARFGAVAVTNLPLAPAGASLALAMGAGVALSVVGVLYPAMVAARMRPVMALRAEL